ncbi:O-acetyl-ADP-ribose deacetylase (regulator of RNase III), contains Macro domain [[Eubacterium] yurii]|nr:O-acetyl-ADP-ribose deacetylase (regulator of RNase III), contains Macro domain [[Eubacterium] yurii]
MPFKIVRNDITRMQVDAIVNTANKAPTYSSGVDTAVYHAAGEEKLLAARREIGYLNEGEVAITSGFDLPAKYIIHAVSPKYCNNESKEEELLRSCYKKSLILAKEKGLESIAFPIIATGSNGYPIEDGLRIAMDEINSFLMKNNILIYIVVFDTRSTKLGLNIDADLKAYIDHNYVCEKRLEEYGMRHIYTATKDTTGFKIYKKERDALEKKLRDHMPITAVFGAGIFPQKIFKPKKKNIKESIFEEEYIEFTEEHEDALKERLNHVTDSFQEYLLYLIGQKGFKNSDVYNRAMITKQTFSKIKKKEDYHPDKFTVLSLCVGAKLNLDETKDLLLRAGYALSPCDKRDIIFKYYIENELYDMPLIDISLEDNGLSYKIF